MASAAIASQNESSWANMGKIQFSSQLNTNPKPKKKQKQFHHAIVGRYHSIDSPVVTQTTSDDAYSFNQTSTSRSAVNYGHYLTFNAASSTKSEILELRKRLSFELERVRDLQHRIDSAELSSLGSPISQARFRKFSGNEIPSAALGSVQGRPGNGLYDANCSQVNFEALLKECRKIVTKLLKQKFAHVFKEPVNAVVLGLHDYHRIVKNPMDLGTVRSNLAKNLYPSPVEFAADVRLTFNNALLYNPKSDPVNSIAEMMLEQFEELFRPIQEKIDGCINQLRERELREEVSWNDHNQRRVSPFRGKKVKQETGPFQASHVSRKIERMQMPMQAHSGASTSSNPPLPVLNQQQEKQEQVPSPVRAPVQPVKDQIPSRGVGQVKLPKPKAKDLNKREMSMDEKQKLGLGLQNLPQEKMPQLVQIIKKRNAHLAQDDDEIELDIETLDTETLWELDRFVTNWKKMASKAKRQALMIGSDVDDGVAAPSPPIAEVDRGQLSDKNDESVKKLKDNEDEDVDIDDDMPATCFPPVEIEKDEGVEIEKDEGAGNGGGDCQANDNDNRGNASSSSSGSGSSSSGSSSSSDSDSGSSSESDSDADDAQS